MQKRWLTTQMYILLTHIDRYHIYWEDHQTQCNPPSPRISKGKFRIQCHLHVLHGPTNYNVTHVWGD